MTLYQHPLAYVLGLEGLALLRAFAGEHDRDFTAARIAEIRALLDRAAEFGDGYELEVVPPERYYDRWSLTYDTEDNGIFGLQDELLLPILDGLTPGVTVDAACGTGRNGKALVARGHRVYGFDLSPGMLARTRANVPGGFFARASLTALPLATGVADNVVCTLALSHLEHLEPFFAEAARVLKPGGHLIISDTRGQFPVSRHYPLIRPDGYLRNWHHPVTAYLRAALDAGFLVRACEEPRRPGPTVPPGQHAPPLDPAVPPTIWHLHPWVPEAADAARDAMPALIVWDFELA